MRFKTIIKEGEKTKANHIYPEGSFKQIKEILQPYLDKKICFVILGQDRDAFLTYNGLDPSYLISDKAVANGIFCGIAKNLEIEDGRGVFEVDSISTSAGDRFIEYTEMFSENDFLVDIYVKGNYKFSTKEDCQIVETITEVLPIIVLVLKRTLDESNN